MSKSRIAAVSKSRIAAVSRRRIAAVTAVAAAVVGCVAAPAAVVPASAATAFTQPYPSSQFISGFSSDESSKQRYAEAGGSDIWAPAPTSDGNLLTVWGDGKG
ncbi:MAG: hypothetical protein J2P57_14695, partial [Acidimicrobiaceae bacterium]|nr:hypothetical protein [Acidimicrobiaceae bacterium]